MGENNPDITSGLTVSQKAELFDAVFPAKFEELFQIDPVSGMASTLYAADPSWNKTTGIPFPYEETFRRYLFTASSDTDPEKVLSDLTIDTVITTLREQPAHIVYYTVHGTSGSLGIKQAAFFRKEDGNIILTIQDVSSAFQNVNRHVEELTNALETARRKISERNNFLSLMNQNLRAPLYSIMGFTRIAEEHLPADSFDDYLHKISMSGSYMQETIDDILNLRQIASHSIHPDPMTIDLKDFFDNIKRMINPIICGKGLLFEMDSSNTDSLQIVTDSHCLQQIVLKMLRSAVSYTVRGGRIRLATRKIFLGNRQISLEISVENRGIVIDRERLQILLRPYEYLKDQLETSISDLDVSLIILRSNLLALGSNTLTVESDERTGTRFSVSIVVPLSEGSPETDHNDVTIPDFTGKRILLVDDNDISLEVSERILFNKGIQVVKARNGQEAVDLFRSHNGAFDLILMDVLMPVMDGLEATRQIRSMHDIPGASTIPVIALTVNAFRSHFEESLQAGMNAHLVKPVEPDQLYRVLMKHLGS